MNLKVTLLQDVYILGLPYSASKASADLHVNELPALSALPLHERKR